MMLRDAWSWMLKTCECFGNVVEHGGVNHSSYVISVDGHAEVPLSIPIVRALVVLAENGGEVFSMFAADILNAKIIYTKCE